MYHELIGEKKCITKRPGRRNVSRKDWGGEGGCHEYARHKLLSDGQRCGCIYYLFRPLLLGGDPLT